MLRATVLSVGLALAPVIAAADAALTRLYDLIEVDAYNQIIRDEGLQGLEDLSWDMLGRPADARLQQQMSAIYDTERLADAALVGLRDTMTKDQIAAAVAYFETESAQRIVELEVAARRAISDEDIEETAREAWHRAQDEKPWLVARVNEIAEVNDLIERNVAGALNSNLQFYKGLADGQGLDMSEDEMLTEVWSQEQDIRDDTAEWLGAYLLMSYDPVSEDDLEAYHLFWQTEAGRALNAAIFVGFNAAYDEISYATGRVLALSMGTEEL